MKISKLYTAICAVALSAASLTSCTDYLDKSPDSDISATDAYKDFQNFQGFTEELYNCIPYFSKGYWTNSWNWGEDEIMNVGIDYHMVYKVDQGDFWGWQGEYDGWKSGWMDGGELGTSFQMTTNVLPRCLSGRERGMPSVRQTSVYRTSIS